MVRASLNCGELQVTEYTGAWSPQNSGRRARGRRDIFFKIEELF